MTLICATVQDSGDKVLLCIECDGIGCEATIKPNPDIGSSGWIKGGLYYGPGDERNTSYYYCPGCASKGGGMA